MLAKRDQAAAAEKRVQEKLNITHIATESITQNSNKEATTSQMNDKTTTTTTTTTKKKKKFNKNLSVIDDKTNTDIRWTKTKDYEQM